MLLLLLFHDMAFFDFLQQRQRALKVEIDQLDSSTISAVPEQQLVRDLAAKYKFEVPVLDEDKAYISYREVNKDVSGDPMRLILDRSVPHCVKATEITFSIPFRGDQNLFKFRPATHTLNPPRGQIRGKEIQLIFTRTDGNADAVKAEYQQGLENIKKYLGWLEESTSDFNSKVGQQVQGLLKQRRQMLSATEDMVAAIGMPIKQGDAQNPPKGQLRTKVLNKGISSPKKWDVFISHAGEDKDELVRPLAGALRSRGISVWYDEFSLKMGDSLRASIDYGLANSRYGVVVLSKDFFSKRWPMQELNGLTTREADGKKVILPIWHKVDFEEVREFSPMLADRLASASTVGVDKLVQDIAEALEQE